MLRKTIYVLQQAAQFETFDLHKWEANDGYIHMALYLSVVAAVLLITKEKSLCAVFDT